MLPVPVPVHGIIGITYSNNLQYPFECELLLRLNRRTIRDLQSDNQRRFRPTRQRSPFSNKRHSHEFKFYRCTVRSSRPQDSFLLTTERYTYEMRISSYISNPASIRRLGNERCRYDQMTATASWSCREKGLGRNLHPDSLLTPWLGFPWKDGNDLFIGMPRTAMVNLT